MTDWDLSGCCNKPTIVFLCCYAGYSLFTMFFMNSAIVKPMKLISIFIHEMGHASAAWLTGGKVDKIEVYDNEGGVTNFRDGWKPAIIPAGYVGVSFWGGVFVALSGHKIGATIAAGIFIFALIVCLRCVAMDMRAAFCAGRVLFCRNHCLCDMPCDISFLVSNLHLNLFEQIFSKQVACWIEHWIHYHNPWCNPDRVASL